MNLRQLEYLQLIVEKGSFAAAAQAAGVSQPAVSLAMQALEKEWGLALFEKSGRQKLPTPAAVQAAQRMEELKARIGRIRQLPSEPLDWPAQAMLPVLQVGMAPAAALLYGPTIVQVCQAREPDRLLRIVSGSAPELLSALYAKEIDLAIVPRPRRWQAGGIQRHTLHVSAPTVYARAGHPLSNAQSLMEIRDASWAVADRAGTAGNVIEEAHRVRDLSPPRILVQCDGYATLLNLIAHSDMLCVIPHLAHLGLHVRPDVTALNLQEGLPKYEVCMFWASHRTQANASLVRAVVQALKSQVQNAPP